MIVCRTNDGQIVGRTQGGAYWYIVHTYTCSGDANVVRPCTGANCRQDSGGWILVHRPYIHMFRRCKCPCITTSPEPIAWWIEGTLVCKLVCKIDENYLCCFLKSALITALFHIYLCPQTLNFKTKRQKKSQRGLDHKSTFWSNFIHHLLWWVYY